VRGDSAYAGQGDVIAEHAPRASDFTNKKGARNRPLTTEDRCVWNSLLIQIIGMNGGMNEMSGSITEHFQNIQTRNNKIT